jgi:hypothetical protein
MSITTTIIIIIIIIIVIIILISAIIILIIIIIIIKIEIVIEAIVGLEMFKQMKDSENADTLQRILVAKWMYVQGFLNNEFPVESKFIPNHLLFSNDNEDD